MGLKIQQSLPNTILSLNKKVCVSVISNIKDGGWRSKYHWYRQLAAQDWLGRMADFPPLLASSVFYL